MITTLKRYIQTLNPWSIRALAAEGGCMASNGRWLGKWLAMGAAMSALVLGGAASAQETTLWKVLHTSQFGLSTAPYPEVITVDKDTQPVLVQLQDVGIKGGSVPVEMGGYVREKMNGSIDLIGVREGDRESFNKDTLVREMVETPFAHSGTIRAFFHTHPGDGASIFSDVDIMLQFRAYTPYFVSDARGTLWLAHHDRSIQDGPQDRDFMSYLALARYQYSLEQCKTGATRGSDQAARIEMFEDYISALAQQLGMAVYKYDGRVFKKRGTRMTARIGYRPLVPESTFGFAVARVLDLKDNGEPLNLRSLGRRLSSEGKPRGSRDAFLIAAPQALRSASLSLNSAIPLIAYSPSIDVVVRPDPASSETCFSGALIDVIHKDSRQFERYSLAGSTLKLVQSGAMP